MKEYSKEELICLTRQIASGKLAATIVHKVKNILMPITGYVELIKGGVPEEKGKDYFKKIEESGQNLQILLKRFLGFSRPPQERVEEEVDVLELIEEIISLFEHYMIINKVTLQKEIGLQAGKVWGVRNDISLILASVLFNAIEANPPGGGIRLVVNPVRDKTPKASARISNGVNISIDDDGEGVKDEIKDKIFAPFFTTKKGSLGLGLYTSLSLAKGMSGDLVLEGKNKFIISLCKKGINSETVKTKYEIA